MQSSFAFFQKPHTELDKSEKEQLQPWRDTRDGRKEEQSYTLHSCQSHFHLHHLEMPLPAVSPSACPTADGETGTRLHLLAVESDEIQLLEGFRVRRTPNRDLKYTVPHRVFDDILSLLGCRALSLPSGPQVNQSLFIKYKVAWLGRACPFILFYQHEAMLKKEKASAASNTDWHFCHQSSVMDVSKMPIPMCESCGSKSWSADFLCLKKLKCIRSGTTGPWYNVPAAVLSALTRR